jgi:polyisoprenoid-binding protein YceI
MKKGLIALIVAVLLVGAVGFGVYSFLGSPTKGPSQGQPPAGRPPMKPLAQPSANQADGIVLGPDQTLYQIKSDSAIATFSLHEMLAGQAKFVVGTSTGYVSGEIGFDAKHVASSTIGLVRVNARTFVTDDNSRNNAIRRLILKTEDDANEYITFKPTAMTGLPKGAATSSFAFSITGDLTVSGVTKPTMFTATGSLDKDGNLAIHATTVVKRDDFNIVIPNFPFLADVQNEVTLDLDVVATR